MQIRHKTAIVTGSSGGLGRAMALRLARHGADVALVARREPELSILAKEIESIGRKAVLVPADVATRDGVQAAFDVVNEVFGTPDILINAAGIAVWKPFEEITDAEHQAMMDVNYWGAFHWIRCVLPAMKERGSGSIVNVSAGTGKIGLSVTSGFSASKFALTGLSESLHRELLGTNVHVSCIHPGSMNTGFWNEELIPKAGLPPLIRFSPKISPEAAARQIELCIRFRIASRTFPLFVGLLTRVNALWTRLGDLMLWKWFVPIVVAVSALLWFF